MVSVRVKEPKTEPKTIVRQVKKFLAKHKVLLLAFVDLVKPFDRVPREVQWRALRRLGVEEWIATGIKAMQKDAKYYFCQM
jgi:hypothetical protein